MTSQILTIRRILERVCAKKLEATILFVDFSKAFDSIHRVDYEANTTCLQPAPKNRHSHNYAT